MFAMYVVLLLQVLILLQGGHARQLRKDVAGAKLHHQMNKREIKDYFGVSSHDDVPDYEVVTPYQADEHGETISHILHQDQQRKRSLGEPQNQNMHYKLRGFGKNMLLKMKRDNSFLGPDFHIETRFDNEPSKRYVPKLHDAYLVGRDVNDDASAAAIAADEDGLSGMIKFSDDMFFVRPLESHLAAPYQDEQKTGKPHVMFRAARDFPAGHEMNLEQDMVSNPRSSSEEFNNQRWLGYELQDDKESHELPYLETVFITDSSTLSVRPVNTLPKYFAMQAHVLNLIFQDPSIGKKNMMNFVLVKAVLVTDKELGINQGDTVADNGAKLSATSNWYFKNKDSLNTTIDAVALISASSSGGLASFKVMCWNAMSVNGDYGIQTVLTIAHEIAHNFGVDHDEGGNHSCVSNKYIMGPAGGSTYQWSRCSRDLFTYYFRNGPQCLANKPTSREADIPEEWKSKLPGQAISGDRQCQIRTNNVNSTNCWRVCHSLFCNSGPGSGCVGLDVPLDGTSCGPRHWCINSHCVQNKHPEPKVDGNWGPWTPQPCTKTCGRGVTHKKRLCNNPAPANGGKHCVGADIKDWEICNPQECPDDISDRRAACQAKGSGFYEHNEDARICTLRCYEAPYIHYYSDLVKDGTRCSANKNIKDVCIAGECKNVGCDNVLESGVEHDRCGVCGGLGNTCRQVTGNYTKDYRGSSPSYGDIMFVVPVGSYAIKVKQRGATWNSISVKRPDQPMGERLIHVPSWSSSFKYAGSMIYYTREEYEYSEQINVPGPITEPLAFEFVPFYYNQRNQGVDYSYFKKLQTPDPSPPSLYQWKIHSNFTECSKSCATGLSTRIVKCHRVDDGSVVADSACKETQPARSKTCNTQPCPAKWYFSEWTMCSKSCATGSHSRQLKCHHLVSQYVYQDIDPSMCKDEKPTDPLTQDCNVMACPPSWTPLEWAQCSTTCDLGTEKRLIQCTRINHDESVSTLDPYICKDLPKPQTVRPCNEDNPCNVPEERFVGCFNDDGKAPHPMPVVIGDYTDMFNGDQQATVKHCRNKAFQAGYRVFGIKARGICVSGTNASKTYFIDGNNDWENRCQGGWGNWDSIAVFSTRALPKYKDLGCFVDNNYRPVENYLMGFRAQIIWSNMNRTVHQCAYLAHAQNYKYFALQFYGECWASNQPNYDKYGSSSSCWAGVGRDLTNYVYELTTSSAMSP